MSGYGRRGSRRNEPGSEDAPARKPPADMEAFAREICLRQLAMAPRTRSQLADALTRKEVPKEVSDKVLERYSEVGLIDDEAFAQSWVRSRHANRGLAPRALSAELRQRGVDDETIKEAVAEIQPEDLESAAHALVAKKLSSTRSLPPDKRTTRLVGMLARKGYPPGLAYRVVKEALTGAAHPDEDDDLSLPD
ncbi:regulatory protein RecX [Actinocorallia longicatena]|uniref:Regulatory protein RecX n=1 Tax=Actinocorallia longicatena TaxID=111803 RepID=A0ABP6QJY2_9ACTN